MTCKNNYDYPYSEPEQHPFCMAGDKLYCYIQASGYRSALAEQNTSIPDEERKTLRTFYDDRKADYLHQFEGHRAACARCAAGWTRVCASDDELEHLHGK